MTFDASGENHIAASPPRLLVVDDDVVQRTIICKIGRQAGFAAVGAASLQEAEHLVRDGKFDCITLDLGLGLDRGTALLESLSQYAGCLSIVVVSGAVEGMLQSAVTSARSLGFDARCLTKPLNLVELRASLAETYRKTSIQRTVDLFAAPPA